jgi:hypothetical protein
VAGPNAYRVSRGLKRRKHLKRHLNWLACIACLAIASGGCGQKQVPPSTYPGARREMLESPSLYRAKIKALKEGKDINSVTVEDPTKKMTPKQKAAYKKTQEAIATSSDTRDAARLKRQQEQEEQK